MTAKEKAKELYDKVWCEFPSELDEKQFKWDKIAKQCALIAVNEIIEQLKQDTSPSEPEFIEGELRGVRYWQQVKNEINKL